MTGCKSCGDGNSFYWYSHEALCFRCLRTYLGLLEAIVYGLRLPWPGMPRPRPGQDHA